MSGYLRWQAERALGQASGVRPERRLPSFAGGPSTGNNGATTFAETAPGDPGAAARHFVAPSPQQTRSAGPDAMPAAPLTSASPPAVAQTNDVGVAAAPQDPGAPRAPQPPLRADRRVEDAERFTIDDRPPRAPSDIADDKPSPDSSARRGSVAQAPVAPRIATRLARNRPAADRSEAYLTPSPAPDVHIHIGRVELTAVTPAAPSRREPAANAKKPMSLEEYLRRRSGRPS